MNITDIVQRSDTKSGRIFDWSVIALILASTITLSLETLPELSPTMRTVFHVCEVLFVGVFTIEYCLRVATAPHRLRYIFSFYGIIDLMAILPSYLSMGLLDLRALRIVRLFRILRILKLTRYSRAMARFGRAIALAKEDIVLFLAVTAIVLYLSAYGI